MSESNIVEAIDDLIRITLAFQTENTTTAEAVRRLHLVGIKQSRIASLLGINLTSVTSITSRLRQSTKRKTTKEVENAKK